MNYEQYLRIFRIIDEILWGIIGETDGDGELVPFDKRLSNLRTNCEQAKKIISEYLDRNSEMIAGLVTSEAFRRFPAPTTQSSPQTTELLLPLLSAIAAQRWVSEAVQASDVPAE